MTPEREKSLRDYAKHDEACGWFSCGECCGPADHHPIGKAHEGPRALHPWIPGKCSCGLDALLAEPAPDPRETPERDTIGRTPEWRESAFAGQPVETPASSSTCTYPACGCGYKSPMCADYPPPTRGETPPSVAPQTVEQAKKDLIATIDALLKHAKQHGPTAVLVFPDDYIEEVDALIEAVRSSVLSQQEHPDDQPNTGGALSAEGESRT